MRRYAPILHSMIETNEDIFRALRQLVHEDPALQAHLFALAAPNEFLAAIQQLAQSLNYSLEDEELLQAMRAGRKTWIERNLP